MTVAAYPPVVLKAQATFRAVLDALARPGTVRSLAGPDDAPSPLSRGAAAVALTLCDQDTPVWVDPTLREEAAVGDWFRFHCGCPLVADSREAAFAFVWSANELPPFDAFNPGSADYPDDSTTVILQVESFEASDAMTLAGPGIRGCASFRASPLPADLPTRLAANRTLFPCGIDLLLVTENAVAGLPRSVRLLET